MVVWRELRKAGALSLGQGVRTVPDVPAFADGMERAVRLTNGAGGQAMTLHATGRAPEDAARVAAEQNLERLRRRHRDLTARDVFGAPAAPRGAERLKRCAAVCEDRAERVFAALHHSPGSRP